jgi:hypothetical protein
VAAHRRGGARENRAAADSSTGGCRERPPRSDSPKKIRRRRADIQLEALCNGLRQDEAE